MLYSDDTYENIVVYKFASGRVEELFIAQRDEEDNNIFYYDDNTLSYDDTFNIAKEHFGTDLNWENQTLEFIYNKDSISQAIVNNNFLSSEETTTYVLSDEYYGNILTTTEFTLDGSQLIMKDEESGIDINLKVADDCLWQYCYIQEGFDSSYQDMYEVWAKFPHYNIEKLDEWGYEWSNKSIKITVKNGEIVRIVFDTGEYNEDDLDEMLSYYWEAVNSN